MATRSRDKTTIVDIAAASGVSVTTVSRILNGKPDVADDTRQRVLRVMDEIGFAPQSAWRQIRSGRSRLIGFHEPQWFNPPNLHLIMSAALAVEEAGYSINIITRHLSDTELLGIFRSREVDGIIFSEVLVNDRRPELLREYGFPFVMVGHRAENAGLSIVDVDIDYGIEAAIDHLVALGHRDIGFVALDPVMQEKTYAFGVWALQAYKKACRTRGVVGAWCVGEPTAEAMTVAADQLLREHPEITAIIAPQEQSVIGTLKAAQAHGLRIPDELSVVATLTGSIAELATPPLTTIEFPADEMGDAGARMLIRMLTEGTPPGEQVFLSPQLVVRGSTATPNRARR